MSCLGHQLLRKHFPHHGDWIAKLHQVCHSSSSQLSINDELYIELCHEIVLRGEAENFWPKFLAALGGEHLDDWNYPAAEAYIAEFFPKVRKVEPVEQRGFILWVLSLVSTSAVRRLRNLLS